MVVKTGKGLSVIDALQEHTLKSPAGSSFILISVQSYGQVLQRKTDLRCSWPRTEQHVLLLIVIRGLILILCMQVTLSEN
jgi:hypothetical protein